VRHVSNKKMLNYIKICVGFDTCLADPATFEVFVLHISLQPNASMVLYLTGCKLALLE